MAQSSVVVSLPSFLQTETLTPQPLTPRGLDRDPHHKQSLWTPGKNDGCFNHSCYFFSANHVQGSSLLDAALQLHETRAIRTTTLWAGKLRDSTLAPPGHTASKWSWIPAQPTFLTILCHH